MAKDTEDEDKSDEEYANIVFVIGGPDRLLMVAVKINNGYTNRIILDTGATTSIMSLNYALGLGIKIIQNNLKLKWAKNTVSKMDGITEKKMIG